jgi:hypothetical protein
LSDFSRKSYLLFEKCKKVIIFVLHGDAKWGGLPKKWPLSNERFGVGRGCGIWDIFRLGMLYRLTGREEIAFTCTHFVLLKLY